MRQIAELTCLRVASFHTRTVLSREAAHPPPKSKAELPKLPRHVEMKAWCVRLRVEKEEEGEGREEGEEEEEEEGGEEEGEQTSEEPDVEARNAVDSLRVSLERAHILRKTMTSTIMVMMMMMVVVVVVVVERETRRMVVEMRKEDGVEDGV
eukprot:3909811-Rhodomonas_salina.3